MPTGWIGALAGVAIAYGIGAVLEPIGDTAFRWMVRFGTPAPAGLPGTQSRTVGARVAEQAISLARKLVLYLAGGHDVTGSIRELKEDWQTKAVGEGLLSAHSLDLATTYYRSLFTTDPRGEEALIICETYLRERMPNAMQEIEQNAAKAALMGNLFVPGLTWLVAIMVALVLSIANRLTWTTIVAYAVVLVIGLLIFPHLSRYIGQEWIKATRNHIKSVVLNFVLSCRLGAMERASAPE
jgi:hypothetical protein